MKFILEEISRFAYANEIFQVVFFPCTEGVENIEPVHTCDKYLTEAA